MSDLLNLILSIGATAFMAFVALFLILLEDTRNQINKHKNIHKYCKENDIEIIRNKLIVGDYMLPNVSNISIDTKFGLQEIMKNITEKRFRNELLLSKKLGIKLIVLIENSSDINSIDEIPLKWKNQRLEFYKFQLKKQLGLFGEFNEWYLYREAKEKGLKPRKPPQSPEQLRKALHTIEDNKEEYDVSFKFCSKTETGQKILELLLKGEA